MQVLHLDAAFPYGRLTPSTPRPLQGGGAFYSDLHVDGSAVRVQLPQCSTKGGVVITKRGGYIDLVYSVDKHSALIDAIEELEHSITKMVSNKRELWFTNEVNEQDIENMTVPITRSYKSGKFFTLRLGVPRSKLSSGGSLLFNEKRVALNASESPLGASQVIPLVTLDGLKYTSRSVSIEFSALQIMVLNNDEDRGCIIRAPLEQEPAPTTGTATNADGLLPTPAAVPPSPPPTSALEDGPNIGEKTKAADVMESPSIEVPEDLDLEEVSPEADAEPIHLRKQADVYQELYAAAYDKARKLRGAAVEAYARANEIKELYSISDELCDSDFDTDGEEETA